MATQREIENKEIDAYLLFNKMTNETNGRLKAEYRNQYEKALKELSRLESEASE